MKTSLAVIASAVLALSACSGGGSEPTKTATSETPDVETDDEPAPTDDPDFEPLPDLPTFDSVQDAYAAFDDGYLDMEDKEADWSCSGSGGAEETGLRDPDTGEVFNGEEETCWLSKTSESMTIVVVEGASDENALAVMGYCDEYGWDTCFAGDGWAVVVDNEAMLEEVVTGLGVDEEWMEEGPDDE